MSPWRSSVKVGRIVGFFGALFFFRRLGGFAVDGCQNRLRSSSASRVCVCQMGEESKYSIALFSCRRKK